MESSVKPPGAPNFLQFFDCCCSCQWLMSVPLAAIMRERVLAVVLYSSIAAYNYKHHCSPTPSDRGPIDISNRSIHSVHLVRSTCPNLGFSEPVTSLFVFHPSLGYVFAAKEHHILHYPLCYDCCGNLEEVYQQTRWLYIMKTTLVLEGYPNHDFSCIRRSCFEDAFQCNSID